MDNSNTNSPEPYDDPNMVVLDNGLTISIDQYNQLAAQELTLKKAVLETTDDKKHAISKNLDDLYEQINRDRPEGDRVLLNNIESIKKQASDNSKREIELFVDYIDSLYPSQFGNPVKEKPEEFEEEYLNNAIREDSSSFFIFDEIAKIIVKNPAFQATSAAQAVHVLSSTASRNSNNAQTIVDYLHNPTPAGRQNIIATITNNVTRKNQDIGIIGQAVALVYPTYQQPIIEIAQENQKADMTKFGNFLNYIDFKIANCTMVPLIDQSTKNDALFSFGSFFKR